MFRLQVPDAVPAGSYGLRVRGTGGLTFENQTRINLQAKSISIFIQTDKATYKPGQTGTLSSSQHDDEDDDDGYDDDKQTNKQTNKQT